MKTAIYLGVPVWDLVARTDCDGPIWINWAQAAADIDQQLRANDERLEAMRQQMRGGR